MVTIYHASLTISAPEWSQYKYTDVHNGVDLLSASWDEQGCLGLHPQQE